MHCAHGRFALGLPLPGDGPRVAPAAVHIGNQA